MAPEAGPRDTRLVQLYREQYRALVRLASVLVDDVGVAEEIVQEAFVGAFRPTLRLRDDNRLPAYLRSAVLNGARSHLRGRRVRRRERPLRPVDDHGSAESVAMIGENHRVVLAALRRLPERQRDVLVLRYYAELSEEEISNTLGIGRGTVKTHAHRGLAALAELLEDVR